MRIMAAPLPSKTIPPAIRPKTAGSSGTQSNAIQTAIKRGRVQNMGEKIGIYGPGGEGKTELVANVAQVGIDPLFIDLDQGSLGLDVARSIAGDDAHLVRTFQEVRAALHNHEMISQFGMVVIDTFSALEDVIRDFVIETIPHEKGIKKISSIEDYGFGKGLIHCFEQGLLILQDLDAISRMGVHVCVICHQTAERVPSADSEDFLEYQPRLQSPPKAGKLRERVFEWTNHFFRIDHDRYVKDGKAAAGDSRSIHTVRSTTAWAKHRKMANGAELPEVIPFPKGSVELWERMFREAE
jgi:hypothetical protein